jgi:hypothetical protein
VLFRSELLTGIDLGSLPKGETAAAETPDDIGEVGPDVNFAQPDGDAKDAQAVD